jgi:hypothetical protein
MRRHKVDALTRRKVHVAADHVIGIRRDGVIDVLVSVSLKATATGFRMREVTDRRPRRPAPADEASDDPKVKCPAAIVVPRQRWERMPPAQLGDLPDANAPSVSDE